MVLKHRLTSFNIQSRLSVAVLSNFSKMQDFHCLAIELKQLNSFLPFIFAVVLEKSETVQNVISLYCITMTIELKN